MKNSINSLEEFICLLTSQEAGMINDIPYFGAFDIEFVCNGITIFGTKQAGFFGLPLKHYKQQKEGESLPISSWSNFCSINEQCAWKQPFDYKDRDMIAGLFDQLSWAYFAVDWEIEEEEGEEGETFSKYSITLTYKNY